MTLGERPILTNLTLNILAWHGHNLNHTQVITNALRKTYTCPYRKYYSNPARVVNGQDAARYGILFPSTRIYWEIQY